LMSLQFLGTVPGTTSNAVKCIRYAIDQKKRGVNVRVINASWGGANNSLSLHDTIAEAGREGIVFVCAAGNGVEVEGRGDDVDEVPDYPAVWAADLPSVISVAALDKGDLLAGFSNYGHTTVTVAAPGVLIKSTVPGDYGYLSGTSMSAPHVSGIVALLTSYSPSLTPEQIKQRIIRTAVPVLSVASKTVASGRANAFNALTDNVAPVGSVGINRVQTNKKFVYVDGLNFVSGTSVVEVNGVALPKTKGDGGYAVGNGTVTRLSVKLGKPGVKSTFPQFTQVFVTVFNPETGERSQPKGFTRF
jgi:subtilisin family serine protease